MTSLVSFPRKGTSLLRSDISLPRGGASLLGGVVCSCGWYPSPENVMRTLSPSEKMMGKST